jgi:hypothetical protein
MRDKEDSPDEMAYEALNPCGLKRKTVSISLAPRLSDLSAKVIYCVSQHIAGADEFLSRLALALPRLYPGVRTAYRRRTSAYMTDDPELREIIASEADGVIYGCGA